MATISIVLPLPAHVVPADMAALSSFADEAAQAMQSIKEKYMLRGGRINVDWDDGCD